MFTGIVQNKTKVTKTQTQPFGLRLWVQRAALDFANVRAVEPGDSICVSGVCLTVSELTGGGAGFDVIKETLDKTTLSDIEAGAVVNLEPAVTANQPLGGHFMQGHVDGVAKLLNVKNSAKETRLTISPPLELMDYIVAKGSVALDGVSLTIAGTTSSSFDVALIPTTLQATTLGEKKSGDLLNIEADILAKTTVNYLQRQRAQGAEHNSSPTVDKPFLVKAGFI